MSTPLQAPAIESARIAAADASYIGIDYHKKYSVWHALDAAGNSLGKGRIEHHRPQDFAALLRAYPRPQVVFEASMNWHWLFELLEAALPRENIVLANPFLTRVIAEAQVKNDKLDASRLAHLLRANLIARVHIPSKPTRQSKELLRQRAFFVKQRTQLRNRIHRLLGGLHDLALPQCSDLFGKKGMSFLERAELPAHDRHLLDNELAVLRILQERIRLDEKELGSRLQDTDEARWLRSLPGFGAIVTPMVLAEIDGIQRFPSADKLIGYAGLCSRTSASGGKLYQGKLVNGCNKWLRWAYVEAAWVAVGASPYFGQFYKQQRARGKKANIAITIVARRLCRISWQLLTQKREFENIPLAHQSKPESRMEANLSSSGLGQGKEKPTKAKPPVLRVSQAAQGKTAKGKASKSKANKGNTPKQISSPGTRRPGRQQTFPSRSA